MMKFRYTPEQGASALRQAESVHSEVEVYRWLGLPSRPSAGGRRGVSAPVWRPKVPEEEIRKLQQLSGSFPPESAGLTNLRALDCWGNVNIEGRVLAQLSGQMTDFRAGPALEDKSSTRSERSGSKVLLTGAYLHSSSPTTCLALVRRRRSSARLQQRPPVLF